MSRRSKTVRRVYVMGTLGSIIELQEAPSRWRCRGLSTNHFRTGQAARPRVVWRCTTLSNTNVEAERNDCHAVSTGAVD